MLLSYKLSEYELKWIYALYVVDIFQLIEHTQCCTTKVPQTTDQKNSNLPSSSPFSSIF